MWSFFPLLTHLLDFALLLFPFLCHSCLSKRKNLLLLYCNHSSCISLYYVSISFSLSCSSSLWDFLFGLVVCLDWFGVLWLWDLMIFLGFEKMEVLRIMIFFLAEFSEFFVFFWKISRFLGCGNLVCLLGKIMKFMLWGKECLEERFLQKR